MEVQVSLAIAFAGGLVSFVSPCVLPLVPTYLTYLTGSSFGDGGGGEAVVSRGQVMQPALAFILGFSTVFIAFGLGATFIGQFLMAFQGPLQKISGVAVVLFGLHTTGWLTIPGLERERRLVNQPRQGTGFFGAFALGGFFSAGWTPCIGPVLGSVLLIASQAGTTLAGAALLGAYSAGLALPFLASALLLERGAGMMKGVGRHLGTIKIVSGLLMIAVGIMLFTGYFARLAVLFDWGF